MAGTAPTNPLLFVAAILVILAWRVAGYCGLDRVLLPVWGRRGDQGKCSEHGNYPYQPDLLARRKCTEHLVSEVPCAFVRPRRSFASCELVFRHRSAGVPAAKRQLVLPERRRTCTSVPEGHYPDG